MMIPLRRRIICDLASNKIYLKQGQDAPKGVTINKGKRNPDARWYDPTVHTTPEQSAPPNQNKPVQPVKPLPPKPMMVTPTTVFGFNETQWSVLPMNDRKEEWGKMSVSERDRMANASKSIPNREKELLSGIAEWANTGNLEQDIQTRVASAPMPKESQGMITSLTSTVAKMLGSDQAKIRPVMQAITDTLLSQELEGFNRQLGDHGIHHIKGDIDRGISIMQNVPGEDTPEQIMQIYLTGIFHDAGYMTGPSRVFLDEGHPRWSHDNFQTNIAPLLSGLLDSSTINGIGRNIGNHDSSDISWDSDPVGSAFRVADNTALFAADKLPPVFRYVPSNIDILADIAAGTASIDGGKDAMKNNIKMADIPDKMKESLSNAVDEITDFTPKSTLGMLGGKMVGSKWEQDHVVIEIAPDATYTKLNKLADLGQNQFAKFAKSYGYNPDQFKRDLEFNFRDNTGRALLTGRIV